MITTKQAASTRAIRVWLLAVAALIAVMVLVGGATRLTESGLSIVEWKPVTGTLPPLSQSEWEQAFDPKRPDGGAGVPEAQLSDEVQAIYALEDGPDIVESAVTRARDALGCLLGSYLAEHSKAGFDPATFRFASLKRDLIAVASRQDSAPSDALARPTLTGATKARVVEQCFTWRGI